MTELIRDHEKQEFPTLTELIRGTDEQLSVVTSKALTMELIRDDENTIIPWRLTLPRGSSDDGTDS